MSRVAKNLILLPEKVEVEVQERSVVITGPLGQLTSNIHPQIEVHVKERILQVVFLSEDKQIRCQAGTLRANLYNHVQGVSKGFTSSLMLVRVGARAQLENDKLVVHIGYSQPKYYVIPKDISIKVPTSTEILVEGIDIQRVNQVAAEIIQIRPPEVYKGTGILKKGQKIKLKVAKKK